MVYHIRTGVRRAGPRLTDRGNPGRTLCGAELTAYDQTVGDARRTVRLNWDSPQGHARCEACFGRLLDLDFARTARAED